MRRATLFLGCLLALSQTAVAGNYNPLLGTAEASRPQSQKNEQRPVPSMTMPPPPVPQYQGGQATNRPEEKQPESITWRIVGRIGDQITLSNQYGDKAVVPDGTVKSGCLVAYPDVVCERAEMAAAKQRLAAERRAREEEETTVAAQKAKIGELGATIADLRKEMNNAYAETARYKAENAKMAEEKAQFGELPEIVAKLRTQLETSTAEGAKLKADVAGLKAENGTLKASQTVPPAWVKGAPKEYDDASLGKVTVRREGTEVFFCVANEQEKSADGVFGKSVLRKERRGDYTYYALNSKNVKFKE